MAVDLLGICTILRSKGVVGGDGVMEVSARSRLLTNRGYSRTTLWVLFSYFFIRVIDFIGQVNDQTEKSVSKL